MIIALLTVERAAEAAFEELGLGLWVSRRSAGGKREEERDNDELGEMHFAVEG